MAPGTTLNAGSGNILLRLGTGAGHAQTTGDISVANLTGIT